MVAEDRLFKPGTLVVYSETGTTFLHVYKTCFRVTVNPGEEEYCLLNQGRTQYSHYASHMLLLNVLACLCPLFARTTEYIVTKAPQKHYDLARSLPSLGWIFIISYHYFAMSSLSTNNDPSAGSPTETLLRLLLPLNDQV